MALRPETLKRKRKLPMNNTIKRGISGTVFLVVMICGLLLNRYLFAAMLLFIMVSMMYEFYSMTMGHDFRKSKVLAILSGVTLFASLFLVCAFGKPVRTIAVTIFPLLLLMSVSLFSEDREKFWKFSHMYTGFLYIAVPLACANMLVFDANLEFNGLPLLCFFILIWASDVGAFAFGITLGQKYGRKLCPSISPKKSWIGFWGGMLSAVLAALIMNRIGMMTYPLVHCLLLAVVMHVAGVVGDLFESQWKRCYNLKDSGNIIPGHGGMLDRFDSALMAIPAGVLYLLMINVL